MEYDKSEFKVNLKGTEAKFEFIKGNPANPTTTSQRGFVLFEVVVFALNSGSISSNHGTERPFLAMKKH